MTHTKSDDQREAAREAREDILRAVAGATPHVEYLRAVGAVMNAEPCSRINRGEQTEPCLVRERNRDGRPTPFQHRRHERMCASCAAYWHVEMACLVLEGRV